MLRKVGNKPEITLPPHSTRRSQCKPQAKCQRAVAIKNRSRYSLRKRFLPDPCIGPMHRPASRDSIAAPHTLQCPTHPAQPVGLPGARFLLLVSPSSSSGSHSGLHCSSHSRRIWWSRWACSVRCRSVCCCTCLWLSVWSLVCLQYNDGGGGGLRSGPTLTQAPHALLCPTRSPHHLHPPLPLSPHVPFTDPFPVPQPIVGVSRRIPYSRTAMSIPRWATPTPRRTRIWHRPDRSGVPLRRVPRAVQFRGASGRGTLLDHLLPLTPDPTRLALHVLHGVLGRSRGWKIVGEGRGRGLGLRRDLQDELPRALPRLWRVPGWQRTLIIQIASTASGTCGGYPAGVHPQSAVKPACPLFPTSVFHHPTLLINWGRLGASAVPRCRRHSGTYCGVSMGGHVLSPSSSLAGRPSKQPLVVGHQQG